MEEELILELNQAKIGKLADALGRANMLSELIVGLPEQEMSVEDLLELKRLALKFQIANLDFWQAADPDHEILN